MSTKKPADVLRAAAEKVDDELAWLWPGDLVHLRKPLVAWLRDEAHAVEDNPGRYCGAALDMAKAILSGVR
jgi:hypothetical protein